MSESDPPKPENAIGPSRPTLEHTGLGDTELQQIHAQLAREKSEPSESFAPMPLVLVFLFAGLSFWAGLYLIKYSGNFSPFAFDETLAWGQASSAGAGEAVFDPMVAGERFYRRNCVICHMQDGRGVAGNFPPVAGSDWVQGSEERLIKVLLHGLAGPIQVNGNTYNNVMPAFGTSRDREIAAVLTWMRTNPAWGNNAEPVSEETVARIRAEYSRSTAWSGPELQAIYD